MFVGGNLPTSMHGLRLYAKQNVQIDSLKISDLGIFYTVYLLVEAQYTSYTAHSKQFRFYMGNTADISYKNYKSTGTAYGSMNSLSYYFEVDTLQYPVGSELYFILYPASDEFQYYYDLDTGLKIYSSINMDMPSEVAGIIVPEANNEWYDKTHNQ